MNRGLKWFLLMSCVLIFGVVVPHYCPPPWPFVPFVILAVWVARSMWVIRHEEEEIDPDWIPFIQSPLVDKLLRRYYTEEHIPYTKRKELECTKAWSDHGLGEMVAFFHQHLDEPCSLDPIQLFSRAGFMYGYFERDAYYLNAITKATKTLTTMKAENERALQTAEESHRRELEDLKAQHMAYMEEVRREREEQPDVIAALQDKIEALQKEHDTELHRKDVVIKGLREKLRGFENPLKVSMEEALQGRGEVEELMLEKGWKPAEPPEFKTKAEKVTAIVAYYETHNAKETADYFGVTEDSVRKAASRAKKKAVTTA